MTSPTSAIETAREALEPFAKANIGWQETTPDDWSLGVGNDLILGDLRRARTAYDSLAALPAQGVGVTEAARDAFYKATTVTGRGTILDLDDGLLAAFSHLSALSPVPGGIPAAGVESLRKRLQDARDQFEHDELASRGRFHAQAEICAERAKLMQDVLGALPASPSSSVEAGEVEALNVAAAVEFYRTNPRAALFDLKQRLAHPATADVERLTRERDDWKRSFETMNATAVANARERNAETRRATAAEKALETANAALKQSDEHAFTVVTENDRLREALETANAEKAVLVEALRSVVAADDLAVERVGFQTYAEAEQAAINLARAALTNSVSEEPTS